MKPFIIALLVLFALATLGVLIKGIVTMAQGKDVTGRQSNKLMSYRVALQLVAVILVVILLLMNRAGG